MMANMTLDDVAPDTITLLTKELRRLFRYAECEPECHACNQRIKIGQKFQLATYTAKPYPGTFATVTRDVMLCVTCTISDLAKKHRLEQEREQRESKSARGGYSRPSRQRIME